MMSAHMPHAHSQSADASGKRGADKEEEPMKIAVFEATGRTGSQMVRLALQDGDEVNALVLPLEEAEPQEGRTLV
ncbi:hypothetical protein [Deinococcus rubellus]|uniref:hypothetical protein n=1 Tax=Deinococcus rubellus TaxID=1889240 RepID=UPI0031EDEF75